MADYSFIHTLATTHLCLKEGKTPPPVDHFDALQERWLGIFGIGKLEFYRYIYGQCTQAEDLVQWLFELKGADAVQQAQEEFERWWNRDADAAVPETPVPSILSPAEQQHWLDHGFVKVSGLVPLHYCDAVKQFICDYQGIDLADPATWYQHHEDWHGLMLQVYQHPDIAAIRLHPPIKQVFAGLYQTQDIVANTDKVSYNPPETDTWKFRHYHLHWDMDLSRPADFYIQGLIYLDDTPANRGPLKLVPGFHHRYAGYVQQFGTAHEAQLSVRNHPDAVAVPGQKGDVVLWLQTLPHAASANHSDQPRFVQYLNFTKL